ncbi:MAG TPA: AMP-binding protein [Leptospiraceae bacterium]|nr:AMP-binding protein [Leptospiraceae bacterium]
MALRTFYDIIDQSAKTWPSQVSFRKRGASGQFPGRTFSEIKRHVDSLTAGFIAEGIQPGDRVTYLCDSSPNWLIGDCAITSTGAVSVPRGTDVTDEDIKYILSHSESRFALVQREKDKKRLEELKSHFKNLEKVFVLQTEDAELARGKDSVTELMEKGDALLAKDPELVSKRVAALDPGALATLIYTSGTTGSPKGVMLNQFGWVHAIERVLDRIQFTHNDRAVSLLPPWHAFERAVEYGIVMRGMDFLVSDIQNLRNDLFEFKPTVFPSVPRIWETVYNGIITKVKKESPASQAIFNFFLSVGSFWARWKAIAFGYDPAVKQPFILWSAIRRITALLVLLATSPLKLIAMRVFHGIHAALGGHLRMSVSGGSALPGVVDQFLTAIGITVLEGYGMTETSAVISIRRLNKPTPGTVGTPIPGYEVCLKDDKGNLVTEIGQKGSLWVKSKQILMGYYKRPELNQSIFDKNGFFDTGDIMRLNHRGELSFAGRAKDTIALGGGENVEPVPIEDRLITSEFIDQVMVVGDDKKSLGALIVPHFDHVRKKLPGIPDKTELWNFDKSVRDLFKGEITRLISRESGFKAFEVIPGSCFYIVPRQFDPDTEMTRTLKLKRNVIKDNFAQDIDAMY